MKYAWDYVREDILRERKKERKEGFLEGTRKKAKEITQEMLKQNIDIEVIKKVTKISGEELDKIKQELKLA